MLSLLNCISLIFVVVSFATDNKKRSIKTSHIETSQSRFSSAVKLINMIITTFQLNSQPAAPQQPYRQGSSLMMFFMYCAALGNISTVINNKFTFFSAFRKFVHQKVFCAAMMEGHEWI